MIYNELKKLILVGGGHSHLYLIKQMIYNKLQGYEIILISADKKQYYSGMASGYIEGIYTEEDFSVNLRTLCLKSNINFIEDKVILINPTEKTLKTKSGDRYKFDLLSLDTGSEMLSEQIPGAMEFAHLIKPLRNLKTIKTLLQQAPFELYNIVIIGAGAAGVEIALAINSFGISEKNNTLYPLLILVMIY